MIILYGTMIKNNQPVVTMCLLFTHGQENSFCRYGMSDEIKQVFKLILTTLKSILQFPYVNIP